MNHVRKQLKDCIVKILVLVAPGFLVRRIGRLDKTSSDLEIMYHK